MPAPLLIPSPDSKRDWPRWRDRRVLELYKKYAAYLQLDFFSFQRYFLIPPAPYKFSELQLIMLSGAKRIGKSWIDGLATLPYVTCPGAEIRLYAPVHDLAMREFVWIEKFLFGPLVNAKGQRIPALADRAPQLRTELVRDTFSRNPKHGLMMQWTWGTTIRSRSLAPNDDDWVGEPIDLGIICEPGKFPDLDHSYTGVIKPNLEDRNGVVRVAGTIDRLGMKDLHEKAHDHDEYPTNFCICEVPRWANKTLFAGMSIADLQERIIQERRDSAWKDFSINWLGLWSVHAKTAIEHWDKDIHVKLIREASYIKLLGGPPQGWVEFIAMDTG
ncbi:hypothetical protein LCGC14_2339940, partial [marine sediment metagenome]